MEIEEEQEVLSLEKGAVNAEPLKNNKNTKDQAKSEKSEKKKQSNKKDENKDEDNDKKWGVQQPEFGF